VELTKAGVRLLPYASRSAQLMVDAARAVQDDGIPTGRLALGSLETTAALRLSPILSRYATKYPQVDISLKTAANDELIHRVAGHELDGAFVCGPVQHSELIGDVVFREELVIASAANCPIGSEIGPGCRILVKGPGCAYRGRLEALLAEMGIRDVGRMEFGTLDAIVGCLESGLGITLLPRSLLQDAADAGRIRLKEVPRAIGHVETLFIRRKDAGEFSAMRALLAEFLSVGRTTDEGNKESSVAAA
jgi:DNA-binding transcriptional LysR family regulator